MKKPTKDFVIFIMILGVFVLHFSHTIVKEYIPDGYSNYWIVDGTFLLLYGPLISLYFNTLSNGLNRKETAAIYISIFVISLLINFFIAFNEKIFSKTVWETVGNIIWIVAFGITVSCIGKVWISSSSFRLTSKCMISCNKIRLVRILSIIVLLPFIPQGVRLFFPPDNFIYPYSVVISSQMMLQVSIGVMFLILVKRLFVIMSLLSGSKPTPELVT